MTNIKFSLERNEEDLIKKRSAYLNRRVNRVLSLFTDGNRKKSIDLLFDKFRAMPLSELTFFLLDPEVPTVPLDKGQHASIKQAVEFSAIEPKTIFEVARIVADERRSQLNEIKERRQNRTNRWLSVTALLVSIITMGVNFFSKFPNAFNQTENTITVHQKVLDQNQSLSKEAALESSNEKKIFPKVQKNMGPANVK